MGLAAASDAVGVHRHESQQQKGRHEAKQERAERKKPVRADRVLGDHYDGVSTISSTPSAMGVGL